MKSDKSRLRARWKTPAGKIATQAIENALRKGTTIDELRAYLKNIGDTNETGQALDLRGIELPRLISVKKSDLSGTRFDYAKINWNFAGSKLSGAVFDGAEGLNVDFGGCDLTDSSFVAAKLPGAIFYMADLQNAHLSKIKMNGGQLKGANCCGADFSGADLRMVWMAEADICGTDFSEAKLVGASLGKCRWNEDTHFDRAQMSMEGTPAELYLYASKHGASFVSEKEQWQTGLLQATLSILKDGSDQAAPLIKRLEQLKPEVRTNPDLLWANIIHQEFDDETWQNFQEAVRKAASNMGLSG